MRWKCEIDVAVAVSILALVAAVGASFRRVRDEPRAQGRWIDAPGEDLRERMTHLKGFCDEVAGTGVV